MASAELWEGSYGTGSKVSLKIATNWIQLLRLERTIAVRLRKHHFRMEQGEQEAERNRKEPVGLLPNSLELPLLVRSR